MNNLSNNSHCLGRPKPTDRFVTVVLLRSFCRGVAIVLSQLFGRDRFVAPLKCAEVFMMFSRLRLPTVNFAVVRGSP